MALSNFFWLPVMGAVSDRVGRQPILLLFSILMLMTGVSGAGLAGRAITFPNMLIVLLWFSFLYGSYNGAMVVALTEVVPPAVRTAGLLARLFAGDRAVRRLHAAVATWLIEHDA